VADASSAPSERGSCWWLGCPEDVTNYVTAEGVTRGYCPAHTAQVERYYEAAARQMAKDEHRV